MTFASSGPTDCTPCSVGNHSSCQAARLPCGCPCNPLIAALVAGFVSPPSQEGDGSGWASGGGGAPENPLLEDVVLLTASFEVRGYHQPAAALRELLRRHDPIQESVNSMLARAGCICTDISRDCPIHDSSRPVSQDGREAEPEVWLPGMLATIWWAVDDGPIGVNHAMRRDTDWVACGDVAVPDEYVIKAVRIIPPDVEPVPPGGLVLTLLEAVEADFELNSHAMNAAAIALRDHIDERPSAAVREGERERQWEDIVLLTASFEVRGYDLQAAALRELLGRHEPTHDRLAASLAAPEGTGE